MTSTQIWAGGRWKRAAWAAAAARRELLAAADAPPSGADRAAAAAALKQHAVPLWDATRSSCAICLGDFAADSDADTASSPLAAGRTVDAVAVKVCGHAFHSQCLKPWLAHCARAKRPLSCPTCRAPVCPAVAADAADLEAGELE